jgi:hypothetical protein
VVDLSPYIQAPVIVKKEYNVVEVYHADEEKKVEAVKVEEKQEEQGEQEEQEEEGLNVDPFEYNGQTYYRDAEGNVYQEDEEGAVDDTPIGRWLEAKQKVKFYPKST